MWIIVLQDAQINLREYTNQCPSVILNQENKPSTMLIVMDFKGLFFLCLTYSESSESLLSPLRTMLKQLLQIAKGHQPPCH